MAKGAMDSDMSGSEQHDGENLLVADLREAFALDAESFRAPGPCRLSRSAARGVPLSGCLPLTTLPAGSRLDDFEILEELGRGGMGIVYRARQVSLHREVALKVMPDYGRYGPTVGQRFRAEAQAAGRLHHTNIVPVYAQGERNGHFYYAMELVDGVGLDTVIHRRPDLLSSTRAGVDSSSRWGEPTEPGVGAEGGRPPVRARESDAVEPPRVFWTREDYRHIAALMAAVADALECAHQHGVIHRDVKPHNLLLGKNDRLHLTDFGLARLTDAPHLTVDGEVMGTPAYLSPEQVRGCSEEIDHRTDVYSLGVTLYEMLTGCKPFHGETREQIISGISSMEPVPPRRRDSRIPIDLETICLRAMEKEPQRRYPRAALLAEDLRRYSQGLPILSRRPSWVTKAAKWARGHRTLATACAAVAVMAAVTAGLGWSGHASRCREAQRLLQDAYEQLAYVDYRSPERVADDLERAEALGADPAQLDLVWALSCLGAYDQQGAVEHLQAVLEEAPNDLRALYMLAWAQWRDGDRALARETFDRAEGFRLDGAAMMADAWFFRGLGIHYDEPATAIESYRQANAIRARDHALYPQAVLHLARARNQQLYTTRSLEPFVGAEASLRQLIEHEQYGAYPYYLLSITHRLVAEIHQGARGIQDDGLVARHYAEALDWARRGQAVEPANDRSIMAEAECLESMGRYVEAIEARDRAIEVAVKDVCRWEGYHYRWRLHYWAGGQQQALEDLEIAATFDLQCPFYAHIYPALVLAESGEHEAALVEARALVAGHPSSPLEVIWGATCLRLLGHEDEAVAVLAEHAEDADFSAGLTPPQTEAWVRALYAHCQEGGSLAALDEMVDEATMPWRLWGEADFHTAARKLARGDRAGALAGFMRAYRSFDGERGYTYHAKTISVKMSQDPAWPAWIADSPPCGLPSRTESPGEQEASAMDDDEGGFR